MSTEELKKAINSPVKECTAEEALETLKAERFARWQKDMSYQEFNEVQAAHEFCIQMLSEHIKRKEG